MQKVVTWFFVWELLLFFDHVALLGLSVVPCARLRARRWKICRTWKNRVKIRLNLGSLSSAWHTHFNSARAVSYLLSWIRRVRAGKMLKCIGRWVLPSQGYRILCPNTVQWFSKSVMLSIGTVLEVPTHPYQICSIDYWGLVVIGLFNWWVELFKFNTSVTQKLEIATRFGAKILNFNLLGLHKNPELEVTKVLITPSYFAVSMEYSLIKKSISL